jgi:bromodomain-containing protein 7/9
LERLLTLFEEKDEKKFFAWPVTDQIAPGYSAIIKRPMDLSTMRSKIRTKQYRGLKEFKVK